MVGTSPTMTGEGGSRAAPVLIPSKKKAPAEAGA